MIDWFNRNFQRMVALFVVGFLIACALALSGCHDPSDETRYAQRVYQAMAIDGDTFWQGNDPVSYRRLARIDAPEMPGHCRTGRHCVSGDPYASKRALQYFLNGGAWCKVVGRDVYRRKLAECYVGTASLNDQMIGLGFAEEYRR